MLRHILRAQIDARTRHQQLHLRQIRRRHTHSDLTLRIANTRSQRIDT
jgi:hypothetical protein